MTHPTCASSSPLFPPPRLEYVQPSLFLQLEDGAADRRPERRICQNSLVHVTELHIRAWYLTRRHGDAVALGVEHSPHLSQLAVSLDDVLDGGGLHEERVAALALDDSLDALDVAGGEDGRPGRFHEGPHALVGGEVGVLKVKVV